eukprot:m.291169 g.291169  ORF g.291169 m.291169 type:complete len:154 (+) comp15825_c2_seq1:269-730(+)
MQVAEEDDVAVAETPPYASAGKIGTISITPHLVWDATFGAPCLMFQAFKSTDTGKQDVTISDLGPMLAGTAFDTVQTAPHEGLSQKDHPLLGMPFFFFHPCQTNAILDEMVREDSDGDGASVDANASPLRFLEAFLSVYGTSIGIRVHLHPVL